MIKFNLGLPRNWGRKPANTQSLPPELDGFRVMLKAPCSDDYVQWSTVRAKNSEHLIPFEPKWSQDCLTQNYFSRRLKRQYKEWSAGRGVYFLIHHKADGTIIGGLNINDIRLGAARHGTLGYWIDKDYEGQGYMAEAIRLVKDYAFNVLNLHRLNAACLPHNERSVQLLLALGFNEEGFAKRYLQINGAWQDHRLFGLVPAQDD